MNLYKVLFNVTLSFILSQIIPYFSNKYPDFILSELINSIPKTRTTLFFISIFIVGIIQVIKSYKYWKPIQGA